MVVLPAASVVVTLASTVGSGSAARSLPATSMLKDRRNRARIGGAVHRQGDRVAVLDVAADRAGDGDVPPASAALRMLSGVMASTVMVAGWWCRRCRVARRRSVAVAGRVGGGDAGLDGGVGVGSESLPATSMLKDRRNRARIGGAVDRQGNRVAVLDVAADRLVTATLPPASAALRMLSAVMAYRDGGRTVVSTRRAWSLAVGCCRPRRWW